MASQRLSALDASFLALETSSAHMHVAWKGTFAPRPDGRAITLAALRSSVAARLRHAERFRQRLAFPPGGLAEPVWVDDAHFDIANHVAALARPGDPVTRARFDHLVDAVLSQPLDRRRPLWRIGLVPRLADGGLGLVMKVHHAMVDGKSAVELALVLLDLDPEAVAPAPDAAWTPAPAPGGRRLALEALAERGTEPLRLAGRVAGLAGWPGRSVRIAETLRRAALCAGEDLMRPAPESYLNPAIGPRRRLVEFAAPLDRMLEIRRRHGVKLNDVVLATVAGGLRHLALSSGRLPERVKVMVPVSMRSPEEATSLGNRISFVFIELPVHIRRPDARLAAVAAATGAFKREARASGGEAILGAIAYLPGPLKGRAARLAASPRMYNLTVSNVPGPRVPVYLLGAEMREAFPVVPLSEGHALSIGVFTYGPRAHFGLYADPAALPQVESLPHGLNAALIELDHATPPVGESGVSTAA